MPAIKSYPMQMGRVRSSKTVAPPIASNSPATPCDRSSLRRIAGEAVPGLKPGPRAAPVSKLRQAAAPKDAMYAQLCAVTKTSP